MSLNFNPLKAVENGVKTAVGDANSASSDVTAAWNAAVSKAKGNSDEGATETKKQKGKSQEGADETNKSKQTTKPPSGTWTPIDKSKINSIISDEMKKHNGNIKDIHKELVAERDKPENYYDQNLAIASDYFTARVETKNYGPDVANIMVDQYMSEKKQGNIGPVGPGPVSPWSQTEVDYMKQGVDDEKNTMSFLTQARYRAEDPINLARAMHDQGYA